LIFEINTITIIAVMLHTRAQISRIVSLADQIEADIVRRGLSSGDRYLRTDETAKMLGVDAKLANRALQLLVKRNRVVRRPRLGTIVLDPVVMATTTINKVHLLTGSRHTTIKVMVDSGELLGLQGELPGANIQINAIARADEPAFLESLINESLKARGSEAFVLHASTIEMQRIWSTSGLPVVVQGGVYPSVQNLPSLNSDHPRAATLATEYVLSKGHRRILILVRQRQSPLGDGILLNTVLQTAHAAGLGIDAIDVRFMPDDAEVGAALAADALDASKELPAIITWSKEVADAVSDLLQARGLKVGQDVALVTLDFPVLPSDLPNYPYIKRAISSLEFGTTLGRMLKQVVLNGAANTPDTIVPVELWTPEGGSA
jgi:DNA-binding LacI/PurR family transcriptional regulator/DNA-binding transcriptional regulator YhcF (GntR family)